MTTMTNGQVRKSLAEQIDRLDALLDGLAEGLNELVVAAVKEAVEIAVKEAVRSVLTEVLTNPDLLRKLQCAAQVPSCEPAAICEPASVNSVSLRQRVSQGCSWIGQRGIELCRACGEKVRVLKQAASDGCGRVVERCNRLVQKAGCGAYAAWQQLHVVRTLKYQLLTALTVGAVCGTGAFFAGPWLGAVVSGVGGFATACAAHTWLWLHRMLSVPVELAESLS
jgi:hypothetical protein